MSKKVITKSHLISAMRKVSELLERIVQAADADMDQIRNALSGHTGNKNNPHGVTAAQVGAAAANHGTHVSYSTTAPNMDGTAALGTAGTVARSDHVHPTDTSRAAANHDHSNYVPTVRKVNNKALSTDITITASDVGALPITGGTLTGDLRIKGSGNYGTKINLGDGDYIHFYEPTDDCLEIKAKKINFVVSDTSNAGFTLGGKTLLPLTFSVDTPKAAGTAAVGLASSVARSDHVHPAQTSVSGNAATATKLATARTIRTDLASTSAKSFDGSANVTPGVTGILPINNGGLGNSVGYIRTGQKTGEKIGECSTAEGRDNIVSGPYSHAEGKGNIVSNSYSHAEGANNTTTSGFCHVEGYRTTASDSKAHAEGEGTTASGYASHAEGGSTIASSYVSHAEGEGTIAGIYQHAGGRYNVEYTTDSTKFIIGKGTSTTTRANCFRVTHTGTYATGAYNASGADYAEMFEWADGNLDNADRAGRFVTLAGEQIRLAVPEDEFILGIVSGNPSIIGDVHDDQWQGMYMYDVFGRPLWEDVEVPDKTTEEPNPDNPEETITRTIRPAHTEHRQKLNPEYNGEKEYKARTERQEWDAVGLLGKLVAVDDGTCTVDGWCKVGAAGIATASEARTRYRVMARLDETHIRVMILL